MQVEKSGRTTGVTTGSIDNIAVTVKVAYQACGSNTKQVAKFTKQFTVLPLETVGRSGDSGSLILRTGLNPNPVGLLFASDPTGRTVANRIDQVLPALSSRIGSQLSFVGTTPLEAGSSDLSYGTPDPLVDEVAAVKDRYDDFLFKLPEVVGHGVSYSKNVPGRLVIRLFVKKLTSVVQKSTPAALEGVPIEIEETGEISALQTCALAPQSNKPTAKHK